MKTTAQLKVGDTIKVPWRPGYDTITVLRPYTGSLLAVMGEGTLHGDFALNETGMTLEAGGMFETI